MRYKFTSKENKIGELYGTLSMITDNKDQSLVIGYVEYSLNSVYGGLLPTIPIEKVLENTISDNYIFIEMVRVNVEFRSQGYGNILMQEFINKFIPDKFPDVHAIILYPDETADNNLGIDRQSYQSVLHKFYKRNGFDFFVGQPDYTYMIHKLA